MAHRYTWDKLVQGATRLNPKTRGRNYPYTPKWEVQNFTSGLNRGQRVIVPFVGTKSVLISMRAWGVTQSSLHKITLLFHDVEILTENPNSRNYFMVQYDNKMYWVKKLDRFRNPVTHRCTCADFFFTWCWHNYKAGCVYGPAPRPYQRKTTTYPPRNPSGIIGCCKHIYNAWEILRNSGLTVN